MGQKRKVETWPGLINRRVRDEHSGVFETITLHLT